MLAPDPSAALEVELTSTSLEILAKERHLHQFRCCGNKLWIYHHLAARTWSHVCHREQDATQWEP